MARFDTAELYEFDKAVEDVREVRIAGVDEAGRGPLAGPVVAAAVVLDL
jgi:ribonuclease HII